MDDGDGKLVKLEGSDEAQAVIKCTTEKERSAAAGESEAYLRLRGQLSEEIGVPNKPLIRLKRGDATKSLSIVSKTTSTRRKK